MNIPASLKGQVDIARFALRAAQLERYKPAVSYWAYYWIVKQILAKELHNLDAECTTYTTNIMDKLEQIKAQNPTDEAIVSDDAGQAYIELFGHDTFARADNAVRANKATKSTADTFQAAAAFFDMLKIWGPVRPDIASKTQFAKFHALRILKAIKAGDDPNLSNPAREPETQAADPPLDSDAPAAREETGDIAPPRPTVEDASDQDAGTHAVAPGTEPGTTYDVSPQQQPSVNSRQNSVGGGYFPDVSPASQPTVPAPQDVDVPTPPSLDEPPPVIPSMQDFEDPPPPAAISPPPAAIPPPVMYQAPIIPPVAAPPIIPQPAPIQPIASPPAAFAPVQTQAYIDDDVAVAEAQKHARWAISALNFEDVPTAVKELRIALQKLGAS